MRAPPPLRKGTDTVENWDVETATSDTNATQFDTPRSVNFEWMGPVTCAEIQ